MEFNWILIIIIIIIIITIIIIIIIIITITIIIIITITTRVLSASPFRPPQSGKAKYSSSNKQTNNVFTSSSYCVG